MGIKLLGLAAAEGAFAACAVRVLGISCTARESEHGAGRQNDVFNVFHVVGSFPHEVALSSNEKKRACPAPLKTGLFVFHRGYFKIGFWDFVQHALFFLSRLYIGINPVDDAI